MCFYYFVAKTIWSQLGYPSIAFPLEQLLQSTGKSAPMDSGAGRPSYSVFQRLGASLRGPCSPRRLVALCRRSLFPWGSRGRRTTVQGRSPAPRSVWPAPLSPETAPPAGSSGCWSGRAQRWGQQNQMFHVRVLGQLKLFCSLHFFTQF